MPFSLLVRRSPEGDSVEVIVNANFTVEAVARLAAASFSKEDGAAVCFRGEVLRPEVTLASAGVTAAHFVVLCFPKKRAAELRGRPQAQPSLRRVCSGKGWVVHGLLLEYSDGVRTGFFGENDGSPVPLSDDAALLRRGGVWQDVPPGEELVSISGRNSTMGYLCAALTRTRTLSRSRTRTRTRSRSRTRTRTLALALNLTLGAGRSACASRRGASSSARARTLASSAHPSRTTRRPRPVGTTSSP